MTGSICQQTGLLQETLAAAWHMRISRILFSTIKTSAKQEVHEKTKSGFLYWKEHFVKFNMTQRERHLQQADMQNMLDFKPCFPAPGVPHMQPQCCKI
jgi:hypothetical protein